MRCVAFSGREEGGGRVRDFYTRLGYFSPGFYHREHVSSRVHAVYIRNAATDKAFGHVQNLPPRRKEVGRRR